MKDKKLSLFGVLGTLVDIWWFQKLFSWVFYDENGNNKGFTGRIDDFINGVGGRGGQSARQEAPRQKQTSKEQPQQPPVKRPMTKNDYNALLANLKRFSQKSF